MPYEIVVTGGVVATNEIVGSCMRAWILVELATMISSTSTSTRDKRYEIESCH